MMRRRLTMAEAEELCAISARLWPTICDFPGCDEPATTIALGTGTNTPPKEWRACATHQAVERSTLDTCPGS